MKHNTWKMSEFDEMGGYDCMTGAIRVGHALLDGREYGQQSCDAITPDILEALSNDAKLIATAPAMLSALKVISTWASVDGALVPEHVKNLCSTILEKVK